LENNRIRRVGGTREIELDLRVIAATNQDIEQLVDRGTFREDLYYRLKVFHIVLPPLRERKEDIPAIADYHLKRLSKKMGKENVLLSPAVLDLFKEYNWKGNIRELANTIENSLIICRGNEIMPEDLPPEFRIDTPLPSPSIKNNAGYHDAKTDFDRRYFSNLLQQTNGNISMAAKIAGLSRQHLHLRIKELGIKV
jgi:DNA-binding NtrC family response regulator